MVPAFQPTVLTDLHGNGNTTKDVTFFGMLLEGNLSIGSNDSPGFAKETVVFVLGLVHAGLRSVMNAKTVSHKLSGFNVNYFTYEDASADV